MSSQAIVEGILIIASVIVSTMLAGIVITQVNSFDSYFTMSTSSQKEIMLTKTKIIYATNSSSVTADVWVKNIGQQTISNLDTMDVFFGKINQGQWMPFDSVSNPKWVIKNMPDIWEPTETIQIIITNDVTFETGTYSITITSPNGVETQEVFSIT